MKTEELRNYIKSVFEKCEDKESISKIGLINKAIDDIEAEQKAKDEEYKTLLKDYKDVVIHSSYKPQANVADNIGSFDADKALTDALAGVMKK